MRHWLLTPLLTFALAACSDEPGPNDGGASRDASADGGASGDDGGAVEEMPIVERPSRDTWSCRLERDRADHSPIYWSAVGHDLVATGGEALLARVESIPPNPFDPAPLSFVVSRFGADGSFGDPIAPSPGDPEQISGPALARRGSGFAVVWVEGERMRFAAFDAAGEVVIAAKDVAAGTMDYFSRPELAAGLEGGFGVVYTREAPSFERQVWVLALDADGELRGAPRRLDQVSANYFEPAPVIAVAPGGGYGVLWRNRDGDRGTIHFAGMGADGSEAQPPRLVVRADEVDVNLGGAVGFDAAKVALLGVPGGFLAAWPESHWGDWDTLSGAWSVIRVARLDEAGALRGAPALLRGREIDVDEVEPTLVPFAGGAVGVLWARGTHIYVCAGCVPDHRIDLLLIDPEELQPLSQVVSVTNGGSLGGLLRRRAAVLGSRVLTTFGLTFHVHATPGSATFECTD